MQELNDAVAEPLPPDAPGPAQGDPPRGILAEILVTALLLLFGTTTLVQAFVIPTGSMEDTLLIGDHLLVDKLTYAPGGAVGRLLLPYRDVRRGDIIVFRYPVDIHQTFVKRVLGIPGDRIHLENKTVFLNGKPLDEPYKHHKTSYWDSYRDNFPADPFGRLEERALDMLEHHLQGRDLVVPPDCFFAMGDNRDNSLDSRYWGFVPRSHIIGKPLLIYWSYDTTTERLVSPGIDVEHLKDLARNFFRKTRWSRSLRVIRGYEIKN